MRTKLEKRIVRDPSTSNTNYRFLYQAGAVVCHLLLYVPFPVILTVRYFEPQWIHALLFAFNFIFGLLGYGVQWIGMRILRVEKNRDEVFDAESSGKHYQASEAVLVHVLAVGVFFLMYTVGAAMVQTFSEQTVRQSLIPVLIAGGCAAMTEIGGYLYFVPHAVLVSLRQVYFSGVVCFINFIITLVYRLGKISFVFSTMNTLCLLIMMGCFMLLLNQEYITKPYGGKVARGINDSAKGYSVRVVLIAIAAIIIVSIAVMSLITAIVSMLAAILKFFVARAVAKKSYSGVEEVRGVLDENIAGSVLQMSSSQTDIWMVLFCIIFLIGILGALILMIPAMRAWAKRMLDAFKRFFAFLFKRPQFRKRRRLIQRDYLNFVDTVEETRGARNDGRMDAKDISDYKVFLNQLETYETIEKKIGFAYAVVAVQLRHKNCSVRMDDTPRQISEKVQKRNLISDIAELTSVFEQIQYEEKTFVQGDLHAQATLDRLCVLLSMYL